MIKKKPKNKKLEIDLSGPSGNAFCLLGYAHKLCKQLGRNYEKIKQEMTSGDYENLVTVFDNEFGDYVILYK